MTKEFMNQAINTLIKRGAATEEDFSPSTVTDADIEAFEKDFDVKLPESLKAYLITSCFDFSYISAPVHQDCHHGDTTPSEYDDFLLMWMDILCVPKGDPMSNLRSRMQGFRQIIGDNIIEDVTLDDVKNMIPVGDYMAGAGVMVIDLSKPESEVDIDDEDTWTLRWFDHEEFDWSYYREDDGTLCGRSAFPTLEVMLKYYFCGICDEQYQNQLAEEGDEPMDFSSLINR